VTETEIDAGQSNSPHEHCGIFTIPGSDAIQGAWRDITYEPVRDNIWTVSEGIYRTIFVDHAGRRAGLCRRHPAGLSA
jgi:hypothetical protein